MDIDDVDFWVRTSVSVERVRLYFDRLMVAPLDRDAVQMIPDEHVAVQTELGIGFQFDDDQTGVGDNVFLGAECVMLKRPNVLLF